MHLTISATRPAQSSFAFTVLLALMVAAVLGSAAWGISLDRQPRPSHVAVSRALPVDSAWYRSLPMNPEHATDAYLARVPAASRARNDAYGRGENRTQILYGMANVAAILLLMYSGAMSRMQNVAMRLSSRRFVQETLVALQAFTVFWLLALPVETYETFVLPRQAGLLYSTYADGVGSSLVAKLANLLIAAIAAAALYALARGSRNRWLTMLVAALATWAIVAAAVLPSLVDRYVDDSLPLALAHNPREDLMRAFARANDVPASMLWVQHVGEQEGHYYAGVTGMGPFAHILIDEDALYNLPDHELDFVLAHEFEHQKRSHALVGLLFQLAMMSSSIVLIVLLSERLLARFGTQWGVSQLLDVRALPLLYGLFLLVQTMESPLYATLSRAQERAADAHALDVTQRPEAMADFLVRGGDATQVHPSRLDEFLFWTHPSIYNRVLMAMRWRAAHTGTR